MSEVSVREDVRKLLSFYVNGKLCAAPIESVSEIIGIQSSTFVPCLPEHVKGVTNIRGKVVPLVELRILFNYEPIEYTDRTCIVIIEQDEFVVGYIIDEIADVLTISNHEVVDSQSGFKNENEYVKEMIKTDNGVALLLDIEKLLSVREEIDL